MKLYDMPRIPLRLFLGVQILLFGLVSLIGGRTPSSFVETGDGHAYAWSLMIILAGTCLLLSCSLDLLVMWAHGGGRKVDKGVVVFLRQFRFHGYILAGAVWGGFGYLTMFDGLYTVVDLQTPVYMVFLAWVALEDACRTREVQQGHERRFPHSILH